MTADFVLSSGVRVATPLVVRVAGLPVVALSRLRFAESFALVSEVVRLRSHLATEGLALSKELCAIVGALPGGVEKPALVGLRRAVFQVRMPTGREWNERIAAVLTAGIAQRLTAWTATLGECGRLSAQLPETLAAETQAKHAVLREIVANPRFQRALSYTSPALFGETAKWLADEMHRPRRQSLVRLAKFTARAVAKTSPFSTFTVSGVGTWCAHGPSARFARDVPVRGVLELNGFVLRRLNGALLGDPRLSPRLRPRVNSSAICDNGIIRFLGPSPAEPIVAVPAVPAVVECLRILAGGGCRTLGDLRDALADGVRDDGRIGRFLDGLVELGLLHAQIPAPDLSADPLGDLSGWLAANGGDDFAETTALMNGVRSRLRDPAPVDDLAGHVVRQRALAQAIGELAERAGYSTDPDIDLTHENAVAVGVVGEFAMPQWRPALEHLDVLRCALAALDPALPFRVALGAYCAERLDRVPRCRSLRCTRRSRGTCHARVREIRVSPSETSRDSFGRCSCRTRPCATAGWAACTSWAGYAGTCVGTCCRRRPRTASYGSILVNWRRCPPTGRNGSADPRPWRATCRSSRTRSR